MERAIETQRLRLLRLVAGLLVAVGLLSVGPVSRSFSDWVCGFVGSILSRAELAARYLVIVQARRMMARRGIALDFSHLINGSSHAFNADDDGVSIADCRARLCALQAILSDLPRHALRLLRRIGHRNRADCAVRHVPNAIERLSAFPCDWRLVRKRIERPPDIIGFA